MRQTRKFDISVLDNKRNRRMIKQLGWPGLILLIVVAGITYLFSGAENEPEAYTPGVFHEVTVDEFIDGDTTRFRFNGSSESFRYLIIDAPEVRTNSGRPEPYAVEASERVRELLTEAETVEVEFDAGPMTDDYGRYLAYIYADGEMVNEILVREGLAEVRYANPPNTSHLDVLEEAEAAARLESAGIWEK